MTPLLTRRDFLGSVLGTLCALTFDACARPPDPASFRSSLFRDRVLDKGPIVAFTSLYLARHPEERRAETLVARLFGKHPGTEPEAIKEALRVRVREDFENGRTENLDGWLLSVTEVRLWCLYLMALP
jgi:hypothetical protein